ncbi:hypothetical protein DRN86_00785 [Candidatus Geothermarchaeota archaeon]|nr:MAG: hypothetical protein DRN86_00785 [Candidatus Geothermarchaeota archaeon]
MEASRQLQLIEETGMYRILKNAECLVVEVFKSKNGVRLKNPKRIEVISMPESKLTLALIDYAVRSLYKKRSTLIPFILSHKSTMNLVKHLFINYSQSESTLEVYAYWLQRFFNKLGVSPDSLVKSCFREKLIKEDSLKKISAEVEEFIAELKAYGLTENTRANALKAIKTFFAVNGINLTLSPFFRVRRSRVKYEDRAPTPEELSKLLEVAGLREKAMIAMMALGGFRIGTLVKLKYRHVKRDLERGIIPVHIHVEAEITKGKYHDYDTFIGAEAAEYLKLYLDWRKRGSMRIKYGVIVGYPPEKIVDESPLFRNESRAREYILRGEVPPGITEKQAYELIHTLYRRAGLIGKGEVRYPLRVHSLRKYFRTQLTALGVPVDYIEYMMGHKISTYNTIKSKGVEFLRNIYAASGLSIKPRTRLSRLEMMKELIRAFGYDPERILVKEAIMEPHRTEISQEDQYKALANSFKEMLRKELLDPGRMNNE